MLVEADFETTEGERIKGRYDAAWDTPEGHSGSLLLTRGPHCWRIEIGDLADARLIVRSWSNIDLETAEYNGFSIVDGLIVVFPGEYETIGRRRGICKHRLPNKDEPYLDYVYARWRKPDPVTVRPQRGAS